MLDNSYPYTKKDNINSQKNNNFLLDIQYFRSNMSFFIHIFEYHSNNNVNYQNSCYNVFNLLYKSLHM